MRILLVCLLSFILCACASLSPVTIQEDHTYTLEDTPNIPPAKKPGEQRLMVLPMSANLLYHTTDMAYTTGRYQISYFAHHHWADTPANMLQTNLISALQASRHFDTVNTNLPGGVADYLLQTELVEIKQDFTQHPSVLHLTIYATLIDTQNHITVFSKTIRRAVPCSEDTPYGGVLAANKAAKEVLRSLIQLCMI